MHDLSREELFRQVWERPITKVADDYGISDIALKKICVKHRISFSGRGYWAKMAAGKKVERARFRIVSDPAIDRIVIHGGAVGNLPAEVKEARAAARRREKQPENTVKVVTTHEILHPSVASTARKLEKATPSERGLIVTSGPDLFTLEIGPASVARVTAFLNALAVAAEMRGFRTVKGEGARVFVVDDESLNFKHVLAPHQRFLSAACPPTVPRNCGPCQLTLTGL